MVPSPWQATIKAFYEDDTSPHLFEGTITHSAPGQLGGTIEADFCGGHLKVRLRIPHTASAGVIDATGAAAPGIDLGLNYGATRPALVAETLSTARLIRLAQRLEFRVDGQLLTAARSSPPPLSEEDDDAVAIEQFAGDLAVVQRHTDYYFDIPTEMSKTDRVRMRVARLLIEGHIVAAPRARRLTMVLSGDDSPELRQQLTRSVQQVIWPAGQYAETLGGRELVIGDVYAVHPRASVLNSDDAIAALGSGTAENFEVFVEPADEPYLYLTLANIDQHEVANRYLAAWTLHGIDQPGLPPELVEPN